MHPEYENSSISKHASFRRAFVALASCVMCFAFNSASAEVAAWSTYYQATTVEQALEIDEDYALGVDRFALDEHTEIIGWQLSQRWYFGRQDGDDSGLTFVWQQNRKQQVSVSKDGLRLTRRF